ncbi:uncharacterized protein BDW47DRAFT_120426 [Aspergillus candidus]|uniref:Nineteen complex-related protein 2-domain-containing protein n=1 Tax=Aspergillus candidus TaxID=41067 RepID=A0A2I2F175_ASPCN|nr:nineteen complex-related protein 2-domain-containing protein [Aspergillus candidus]PLB34381.1 nineteen complex-related protein 2-domain-containing protein [Aspergillus candidus]
MSSKFANRRKPRKVGGDDEGGEEEQDNGPVVKRPTNTKTKQKSKLRLSFGPGGTSMTDDDGAQESEVVMPKRHGLGRMAIEKSAAQRSSTPSGIASPLPMRVGPEQDRPSYSSEHLNELRHSTPSTPKPPADDGKERTIDVAAKFGEVMQVSAPSAIPSEAEIREKKSRRARLAKEQEYGGTEKDFISLDDNVSDEDWDPNNKPEDSKDTRLLRDDEDFAEGFDEFVEDGRISLGKRAEREHKKKQREQMRELIDDAEGLSDEDDTDLEEKAAYEAAQTRAAMGHGGKDQIERPKTPPRMTSLPQLSHSLDRLRTTLAVMNQSKVQMINRMEDLRKEKADIATREVEIQALIKEAGDNYERLKQEAGAAPGPENDASGERGLETIGSAMDITRDNAEDATSRYGGIPFIETPIDENDGDPPHLYRHSDATPIELFFDLFFVANLSTFTATHEIHNVEALGAYIGFLAVIWFTWLQVTLFDTRFARDTIFERICKAIQLAAMVGFASAGTRLTTRVQDENVWAFQSLSLFLGGSRALLSVQYAMFWAFRERTELRSYIRIVWGVLFGLETLLTMGISCSTPGIGFHETHLNVRMGLLTLIIIGEGVIAVTRIVNKTSLGQYSQQIWAQLHYPFHVVLILLLEGSQILALTLDITLKLTYLTETIMFACEEPRPPSDTAIGLLRSTIEDMEINYSRGAIAQEIAIAEILGDLPNHPLCMTSEVISYSVTNKLLNDLVGNVTAALFTSMGVMPSKGSRMDQMTSDQLLRMYMEVLGFVYMYFFAVASLAMFLFAAFVSLAHSRSRPRREIGIRIGVRMALGMILACLVGFIRYFALAYAFMTSPVIMYAFTFTLLIALLTDRLLDQYGAQARARRTQESETLDKAPGT